MHQEIITSLPTSQDGGINSVFSDLPDQEFFRIAATYFTKRDVIEAELKEIDRDLSVVCRAFGERLKLWGMSPTILRRELKLRGYGV
jgi:hypothetical protein